MQAELTPNGAAMFIAETRPGAEITYGESVESCGPSTATIPAYLTDAQQATILGADVVLRSAVDVEWFGRVDSYKDGVLSCAGTHARLSDTTRPADYVNSTGAGFRPVSESAEAARYSKELVANVTEDGKVQVDVQAGQAVPTGYTGQWWFPRFANVRGAAANASPIVWHRHTVANWRLRVYSCTATGLRGDKLWEQAAGTGSTDGSVAAAALGNTVADGNGGNGYLFYIECTTGYTPGVNATAFIQPRIYDGTEYLVPSWTPADPPTLIKQLSGAIHNDDDYISTALTDELDDLMFDLSTTEAAKIDEVCKRTGYEFFWRWDWVVSGTKQSKAPYFRTPPTTPLYYVDATDPNVTADLTFGAVKDYYDQLYIIGQKGRYWGDKKSGRYSTLDPWCWGYRDCGTLASPTQVALPTTTATNTANPLAATGIHRTGIVDVTGYTGSQTGIVSAFFNDNGRLKVSGTIGAVGVKLLDGTPVPASHIRCNEVIRVNTRQGLVDARITAVEHVGELTASITVGDKAQDFESVLARLLGKA